VKRATRYGPDLVTFFKEQPHLYEIVKERFPVDNWLVGSLARFGVEDAFERFKDNLAQASALMAHWGEYEERKVRKKHE
jgi:hypothetical protein